MTITVIGVENLNVSSWDLNKNVLDSIEYKSTIFFFLVSREQIVVALRKISSITTCFIRHMDIT